MRNVLISTYQNIIIFFCLYPKSMSRSKIFQEEINEAFQNGELLLISVVERDPKKTLGIHFQLSLKMYNMHELLWSFPNDKFNSEYACISIKTCAIGLKISVAIVKLFHRNTQKRYRATLVIENEKGNLNNFSNMFKILPLTKDMYEEMDLAMLLSPPEFPLQDSIMCWAPTNWKSPMQYWKNERSESWTFVGIVDDFMKRTENYRIAGCNQYALLGIMNGANLDIYKYIVSRDSHGFQKISSQRKIEDFDMNENFIAYEKLLSNGTREICILQTTSFDTEESSLDNIDGRVTLQVNLPTYDYTSMYLTNKYIAIAAKTPSDEQELLLYTEFKNPAHTIKDVAQRNFALFDYHYAVQTDEGWTYHVLDFQGSKIQTEIQKVLHTKRWRSEDTLNELFLNRT